MTNDLRSMQDMFNGTPTVPFKEGGSYQTALEKLRIELTELNARIEDRDAALLNKTIELAECQKQRDELLARIDVVCEVHIISQTYDRIREERRFAADDMEYDLFAAGWKAAIASVKEKP